MYISDKLVYLELEKTGSTHVIRMLLKFKKGDVIAGKHNCMPQAASQLGILLGEECSALKTAFRTNESDCERDYNFYYDQTLIDLMAEREAFIFDKYIYEKPLLNTNKAG